MNSHQSQLNDKYLSVCLILRALKQDTNIIMNQYIETCELCLQIICFKSSLILLHMRLAKF